MPEARLCPPPLKLSSPSHLLLDLANPLSLAINTKLHWPIHYTVGQFLGLGREWCMVYGDMGTDTLLLSLPLQTLLAALGQSRRGCAIPTVVARAGANDWSQAGAGQKRCVVHSSGSLAKWVMLR